MQALAVQIHGLLLHMCTDWEDRQRRVRRGLGLRMQAMVGRTAVPGDFCSASRPHVKVMDRTCARTAEGDERGLRLGTASWLVMPTALQPSHAGISGPAHMGDASQH